MKKAPQNEVLYFQCRCEDRHQESNSTERTDKQEIQLDERTERNSSLSYLCNPSAPATDEELEDFITEAVIILGESLEQLESEGSE